MLVELQYKQRHGGGDLTADADDETVMRALKRNCLQT
jgi:hypothetical protein